MQQRQRSGSVEVQPSQNGRIKLVETNMGGPKERATQVNLKGGSSVV